MWRGNAGTHACVCVQDARISSQDPAYTSATLDNLCTVCNTCQFIPLRVNYNISRYHTCSHAAHGPNIAFRCVWRQICGVGTQTPMRVCASRTHESPAKTLLRTH